MMMSQQFAPGLIGGFQPIDAIRTELNRQFYGDIRAGEVGTPWSYAPAYMPGALAAFGPYAQQGLAPVQGDPRLALDPRFALDPRLGLDPRFGLDPRSGFDPRYGIDPRYGLEPRMAPWGVVDPRLAWMHPTAHLYSSLSPQVNCAETPDAHLVVIEVPGVDVRDITLQVVGNQLILTAFRKPIWNNGTVTVGYHTTEGRFGTLRRVFHLPVGYPAAQIQANYVNGQITIVLPKAALPMGAPAPAANIAINAAIPATV